MNKQISRAGLVAVLVLAASCARVPDEPDTAEAEEMTALKPYLMYPGTCKDALAFYADAFDGEVVMLQTFAEAPMDVPDSLKDRIFNAEFRAGDVHFMASDDMPGNAVTVGNNVALFVTFSDEAEKKRVFDRLSEGGTVLFPMDDNFGMLEDRFGIRWMMEHVE